MNKFLNYLRGSDLRSIAQAEEVIPLVKTQKNFDSLFGLLFSEERLVVMRAADAIEKITGNQPLYLQKHKIQLLTLLDTAREKELKWHLVAMLPRVKLSDKELKKVIAKLLSFISDRQESRIVRVFSLQALFDLVKDDARYFPAVSAVAKEISKENIPSINSRIRKLKIQI